MKQISFALLASASLFFAQGGQAIPTQNQSDEHAGASREQSKNLSSFARAGVSSKASGARRMVVPDGQWFAFESNRACDDINGQTYAIFIQDAMGNRPAMQISDCSKWNVQHPKWFPPRNDGKVFLIAAVQAIEPNQPACPPPPFRIASFDVTQFVSGR